MRYAKNGESYYAGDGLNKAPLRWCERPARI